MVFHWMNGHFSISMRVQKMRFVCFMGPDGHGRTFWKNFHRAETRGGHTLLSA